MIINKRKFEVILICVTLILSIVRPVNVKAENITTSTTETTFPMHVIHKTGDDKENFVIVIMGDGYTVGQQEQFIEDATNKARGMLTWSPYKEYSDRINIYAMQVVSNESGIGDCFGKSLDTYFNVCAIGKGAGFTNGGTDRAKALRNEIEEKYLDEGANVGTIHILSNTSGSYGASLNSLFSISTNSTDNSDGTVMTHEIAHSIGGLGDEYERYTTKPNTSDTTDPDKIKWNKLLGFRGIGITMAGTETAFAPSRECMMRWQGQPFCEVCKMELARKLNNSDYVSQPNAIYVADPEISLPHDRTGTLDRDSEKYRIDEKSIARANGYDLEFRTVVQNMINKEQHLKITFQILDADGITVKYSAQKEYMIPALSNSYNPEEARESLSVVLPDVSGLKRGDKFEGKIIDMDSQEVLATDKTASQSWSTINIHYQLKSDEGITEVPNTEMTIVHVPENSLYTLRNPDISGYTCVGNNVDAEQQLVTGNSTDIIYYYEKKSPNGSDGEENGGEVPPNGGNTPGEVPPSGPDNGENGGEQPPNREPSEEQPSGGNKEENKGEENKGELPPGNTNDNSNKEDGASNGTNDGNGGEMVPPAENMNPSNDSNSPNDSVPANDSSSSNDSTASEDSSSPNDSVPANDSSSSNDSTASKDSSLANDSNNQKRSDIIVSIKAKIGRDSKISNIDYTIKQQVAKAIKKGKKEDRRVSVEIKCDAGKRKNLALVLKKSTISYLIKQEIKELKFDTGDMCLTMNLKTLKEISRRIKSDVYLKIQRNNKSILTSKSKKIIQNRPIFQISLTGRNKQKIDKFKNGELKVEIYYNRLKNEKKKGLFAYSVNGKGNVSRIAKSYYDSKKKTINFTTRTLGRFAVGYKR